MTPNREAARASDKISPAWRRRRAIVLLALGGSLLAAACSKTGGLPSPSRDAAQGQSMLEIAEALNQIRDQSAGLQEQVDSLRDVVVRQDSVVRQLAATAGITMKPPQ